MAIKNRCPFGKLDCSECRLLRRGIRLVGIEQREEKVENCVFHIIADNLEELHRKVFSMQKEVGEVKNVAFFDALATHFPNSGRPKRELVRALKRIGETDKQ